MRRKRQRFKEIASRENVFNQTKTDYKSIKGKWREKYFCNNNPIVVELACGNGEFTVGLARHYQNKNYIGIDIKGDRIWVGSTKLINEEIKNAAFLVADISNITDFFDDNEIDELWITFPDPQPKKRNEKKRLTNNTYLSLYKKIIKDSGKIHLKTDNDDFFAYSMEKIAVRSDISELYCYHNFYNSCRKNEHLGIKTKYEKMFAEKGEIIKYLNFAFAK